MFKGVKYSDSQNALQIHVAMRTDSNCKQKSTFLQWVSFPHFQVTRRVQRLYDWQIHWFSSVLFQVIRRISFFGEQLHWLSPHHFQLSDGCQVFFGW